MKIIIDIPERLYEHIQNGLPNYLFVERLVEGVKEGTPLPKGYERLIDENVWLEDKYGGIKCSKCNTYVEFNSFGIPKLTPYCPYCGAEMSKNIKQYMNNLQEDDGK